MTYHKHTQFFALLLSLLFISVHLQAAKPFVQKTTYEAQYEASGNDLASINLTLKSNGRFVLNMRSLKDNSESQLRGKWQQVDDTYKLTFSWFKPPELELLFPSFVKETHVQILSKRSFSFPINNNEIWIWGIHCSKA